VSKLRKMNRSGAISFLYVSQPHIELINFIEIDDIVEVVDQYRGRKYNEDITAIERLGGIILFW